MIVSLKKGTDEAQVQNLVEWLRSLNLEIHRSEGQYETILGLVGDPSHAAGMARMVRPLALAAVAAGADGLMIEVHNDPAHALCDGPQALRPEEFAKVVKEALAIREIMTKF